jgi:hypothetical protein
MTGHVRALKKKNVKNVYNSDDVRVGRSPKRITV